MSEPRESGPFGAAAERVVLEPEEGVSRERGPSFWERLGSSHRLSWFTRAEVRVWLAPLSRLVALVAGLSCVAMLGHAAERAVRHGVELPVDAGRQGSALSSPSRQAGVSAPESTSGTQSAPRGEPSGSPPGSPSSAPAGATPEKAQAASTPAPCARGGASDGTPSALTPDGKIVLNEATLADLRRLPGVGEKRALALLELREKLGRFRRMGDLLRVKGIGPRSLRKFAEVAVLDRPAVAEPSAPVSAAPASTVPASAVPHGASSSAPAAPLQGPRGESGSSMR